MHVAVTLGRRVRRGAPLLALLAAVLLPACGSPGETVSGGTLNTLDAERLDAGWRPLFDGHSTAGWRGYGRADVPEGWTADEGALHGHGAGGDLITVDTFGSFELEIEWMIAPGGNSGIFFRVDETSDPAYFSGPEFQVLDDAGYPDIPAVNQAGANYALHAASADVTRPAGSWNQARIVVDGRRVEHWLNGERIVAYTLHDADWKARVAASKFDQWPAYGMAERGHLALQDHGADVWYRNIFVREL